MARGEGKNRGGASRAGRMTGRQYEKTLSPFRKMVYHASNGTATREEITALRAHITNPRTPKDDKQAARRALHIGGYKDDGKAFFEAMRRARNG